MIEFDCCECGRHIVDVIADKRDPKLCMLCIWLPYWFEDPNMVKVLDPERETR